MTCHLTSVCRRVVLPEFRTSEDIWGHLRLLADRELLQLRLKVSFLNRSNFHPERTLQMQPFALFMRKQDNLSQATNELRVDQTKASLTTDTHQAHATIQGKNDVGPYTTSRSVYGTRRPLIKIEQVPSVQSPEGLTGGHAPNEHLVGQN